MNDEEEVIVGYLIQRESEDGELDFWNPETKWSDDPNDAKLYESEDEAEADATALQAQGGGEISVAVVIEDDGEDEDEEDEEV